jgi:hypothetical protein
MMKQRNIVRAVAVAAAVLLAVAGCGNDDDGGKDKQVKVLGTDGNTGQGTADQFKDKGALVGLRGTAPLTDLGDDFKNKMLALNPNITVFNFSAESYDAAIVSALAAETARSTQGTEIAKYINGVTTKGEKCKTFSDCKKLLDQNKDIDYDGVSGPLEFTDPGEPSVASFGIISYDRNNKVSDTKFEIAGDKSKATKTEPTVPARNTPAAGGPLKLGTLLSETGGLSQYGPAFFGGVRLAVKDLNEAGGVNGQQVALEERDDGTDPNVAGPAADALLREDVDVIIGCAGSTVSKSVIDKITGAGVVMFSPSNTSDEFTTYNDRGLYFRTAPPDVLQSRPLANLILDDGADRVAILYQNTSYGAGLAKNVKKNLENADVPGGNVLLIPYDEKGRDFSTEVQKAKNHDPEYVVVVGYAESVTILKKLNEVGIGSKR